MTLATIEIERATLAEAKADAEERVRVLCADGWQFMGARAQPSRATVTLHLWRRDWPGDDSAAAEGEA